MTVASLNLCKELYELSGWEPNSWWWTEDYQGTTKDTKWSVSDEPIIASGRNEGLSSYPAYDLGYLLRKLPRKLNGVNSKQRDGNFNLYASRGKTAWVASYADADGSIIRRLKKDAESQNNRNFWFIHGSSDTPENATAKLAIELWKQGVLSK